MRFNLIATRRTGSAENCETSVIINGDGKTQMTFM